VVLLNNKELKPIIKFMVSLNKKKYKNVILKMAKEMNKYELTTTKLAKILYYLDFISYRDRKKKIINDDFFKRERGPLAGSLNSVMDELIKEDKLAVKKIEKEDGREFHNYKNKVDPDETVFNKKELELLNNLIEKYRSWKTEEIVAKSHLELPWRKTGYARKISFKWANDIDDFDKEKETEYKKEDRKIREALKSLGVKK